ncbi:MAG: MotA/TolQ/ExbB proton channel family protein, partial [Nitrococcus sp.]|nr:MotA/TolQ/ExbB proton channel family protein [Nitrococcus sp.]
MSKLVSAVIGIALTALVTTSAIAASTPEPANSLDALLSRVKAQGQGEPALFAKPRAAFAAAPAEQQQAMMERAQAALEELKAASAQISRQFSENELKIGTLTNQLKEKGGALKLSGLFSVARQTAADVASSLQGSLIATQLQPPRGEVGRLAFLYALAGEGESSATTTAQLKRLWYEMQRAMTAQGQVVRYQAPVVQTDGTSAIESVLRIGPFSATSEGRFLKYMPELHTLSVLPQQLPDEFRESLSAFLAATAGYAPAVVDPTQGVLLGLYVDRPSWLERIKLGQEVGYVIIAVGLIGAVVFLMQLVRLIAVRLAVGKQLKELDNPNSNNPLGRVLLAFKGDPNRIEEDADLAELRITEAVLREEPKLNRFQAFLRLAVAAGPLLGLIGTVIGMIITFQTITET